MTFIISCAGSKKQPTDFNPSKIESLSYSKTLLEARIQLLESIKCTLDWNYTLPAWQLYSGNRSKLYRKVTDANWQKPNTDIIIVSALFGLLKHNDLIPIYNVSITDRIPHINRSILNYWQNYNLYQNINNNQIIDLLSANYRQAINQEENRIGEIPHVQWNDNYGTHKGKWLNEQLNSL
jgi:cytoplasmic iron level regulating protein YaaA (DUF328/UPF0246 family)